MSEPFESPAALRARVDAAIAARRARPPREIATALAHAAARWRRDPGGHALAASQRTCPAMIDEAILRAADAVRIEAMLDLVASTWGPGAADRAVADDRTTLVGHVLASNVPALAIPAIVHALLIGAAVVLKSGRADRWSAAAFRDALAADDPALADTIVATYWSGADPAREAAAFGRADCVVGTGRDATVADLGGRVARRFLSFGSRSSLCVVAHDAAGDPAAAATAIARDVALHEQRGCLSPHAVFVEGANDAALHDWAEALAAALDEVACTWPPGDTELAARAAVRAARDETEWRDGAAIRVGPGGAVLCDRRSVWRPPIGDRTVRVQPLRRLDDLPALLPAGAIEAVGAAGDVRGILSALRVRGVSRVCRLGRLQAPPIAWPRGQRPPLVALRGVAADATMLVEP